MTSLPPPTPGRQQGPIRVLFVCLGNICRSPAAEGVFLELLEQHGRTHHFEVDSAGTGGWHVGRLADARMRAAAARRGLQLTSRARQLEPEDLHRFDLIVTMDRHNLAAVKDLARRSRGAARITPMTSFCRRHRIEDVPDPYDGGPEGFELVLDLLEDACAGLLASVPGEELPCVDPPCTEGPRPTP
jgi:protein-tyrosine phosphatase